MTGLLAAARVTLGFLWEGIAGLPEAIRDFWKGITE